MWLEGSSTLEKVRSGRLEPTKTKCVPEKVRRPVGRRSGRTKRLPGGAGPTMRVAGLAALAVPAPAIERKRKTPARRIRVKSSGRATTVRPGGQACGRRARVIKRQEWQPARVGLPQTRGAHAQSQTWLAPIGS